MKVNTGDCIFVDVYLALGRVTKVTDIKGNKSNPVYSTTYTYDSLGRVLTERIPFESVNGTVYYTVKKHYYDNRGNTVSERVTVNKPGQEESWSRTDYEYNSRNLLTKVTAYNGSQVENITQYYYDAAGSKVRMYTGLKSALQINGLDSVVASGDTDYSVTKYEYDRFGNLTGMTDPLLMQESYAYDLGGNMTQKTDRNGNVTAFEYDGLGRLTGESVTCADPDADASYSYTYSVSGNRTESSWDGGSTQYTYDDLGRLLTETGSDGAVKSYSYDAANNRKSMAVSLNGALKTNTAYTYDNLNRLSQVSEGGQNLAVYAYDANGNRTSLTYSNGNSTVYDYNLANKVKNLTNKKGSTVLSHFAYTYYLDGNQESETDTLSGKGSAYVYDGVGRLSSETEKLNGTVKTVMGYTYDDYSNRETMTVTDAVYTVQTTYGYDPDNRLLTEVKVSGGTTETTGYTYDNNGSQKTKTVNSVQVSVNAYDGFNQLISTTEGGSTYTYDYNADGLRTGKTADGVVTKHIWDGRDIVLETDGADNVTARYIRSINLIAFENGSGARQYYLFNAHGDVVQLADSTGTVVRNYDYDAFGNKKLPVYGDANCDGAVDETDYELIRAYVLKMIDDLPAIDGYTAGDVDGDGMLTASDLARITRYLSNMPGYFTADRNGDGLAEENETHPNYSDPNPFRYCGEYFDLSSGTYYLRARNYDPTTGRFLIEDPVKDGLNYYTYCYNNPITFIDPSGLKTIALRSTIEGLGGTVIWNNNSQIATVYLDGQSVQVYAGDKNGSYINNSSMYTDDTWLFMALGSVFDLGKGWTGRIERGTSGKDYQRHVHIYNENKSWSQNEDGSPHDDGNNSPGSPPNSALKNLNKQKGWDWKQKEKDWLNKIEIGYDPTGYTMISYPNGRTVTVYKPGSYWSMHYSPSKQSLRDYSYGPTYIDLSGGGTGTDTNPSIPFLPMPNPVPAPVPAPMPIPVLP